MIQQLGLRQQPTWQPPPVQRYEAVRLTVQGRECVMDVYATAGSGPIRIGRIAVHAMDWVVDEENQRLIGNPEHGGEEMVECY